MNPLSQTNALSRRGFLGTVFVATLAGPTGPIAITATWELVLANVEYTFILDHSALIAGTPI